MNEELTEKIDRYLMQEMTLEERTTFDFELEKDPILRENLATQRMTKDLLEADAYIDLKEKVRSINRQKANKIGLKIALKVAAILVLMLIPTYFFVSNQFSDQALFSAYAEPYPDRITMMGNNTNEMISEAMQFYNKQEYKEAAELFHILIESSPEKEEFIIYESVSLMNIGQTESAVKILETRLNSSSVNTVVIEWQLILAYLANKQGEKALPLVKNFLKHNNGYQQENAENLLEDLTSSWR